MRAHLAAAAVLALGAAFAPLSGMPTRAHPHAARTAPALQSALAEPPAVADAGVGEADPLAPSRRLPDFF